jgi:hypothetical protein
VYQPGIDAGFGIEADGTDWLELQGTQRRTLEEDVSVDVVTVVEGEMENIVDSRLFHVSVTEGRRAKVQRDLVIAAGRQTGTSARWDRCG